jgi:hypothetical protein
MTNDAEVSSEELGRWLGISGRAVRDLALRCVFEKTKRGPLSARLVRDALLRPPAQARDWSWRRDFHCHSNGATRAFDRGAGGPRRGKERTRTRRAARQRGRREDVERYREAVPLQSSCYRCCYGAV